MYGHFKKNLTREVLLTQIKIVGFNMCIYIYIHFDYISLDLISLKHV